MRTPRSSAIRMSTGAGDSRSRAQVQKETATVAAANAQAQAHRIQETNSGKLVATVEALVCGHCFEAGFGPRSRSQGPQEKENRRPQGSVGVRRAG